MDNQSMKHCNEMTWIRLNVSMGEVDKALSMVRRVSM